MNAAVDLCLDNASGRPGEIPILHTLGLRLLLYPLMNANHDIYL
jgi:hypothetical protein